MADGRRDGFGTVTPYLVTEDADLLLDFILDTFDATILERMDRPDGSVMHVEARIGESMVMIGEPREGDQPMPTSLFVYVEDCDEVFSQALEAGGTIVMQPTTMPQAGARYGGVEDPTGNIWWIATHLGEIVDDEELRRLEALTAAAEEPVEDEEL